MRNERKTIGSFRFLAIVGRMRSASCRRDQVLCWGSTGCNGFKLGSRCREGKTAFASEHVYSFPSEPLLQVSCTVGDHVIMVLVNGATCPELVGDQVHLVHDLVTCLYLKQLLDDVTKTLLFARKESSEFRLDLGDVRLVCFHLLFQFFTICRFSRETNFSC